MTFFAKSSLMLLYLRLFGLSRGFRYTIYVGLVVTFCVCLVGLPVTAYYCAPSPGQEWSVQTIGASCQKSILPGVVQGALNVVLDLFIISLPVPVILGLHMSPRRRIAVLAVFLTGILYVNPDASTLARANHD